jgi:histidyl-tRNA synthetase
MTGKKPAIPKGTRDFGPKVMARRNYIFNVIRNIFEKYGFQPLETPAMENLSVLTGKYGDEGDQLLFKVLNSGDFMRKTEVADYEKGYKHLTAKIADKGLRYDLTVPFARYVVMNRNDITFPFKRFQIQPVWRADRPQKARYREFYQCDADVVGSNSLLCEAENLAMITEVFEKLGISEYEIRLNHRKILKGITEMIGAPGMEMAFSMAIDKLDKIGASKVKEELLDHGFDEQSIKNLEPFFDLSNAERGDNREIVGSLLAGSETARYGLQELDTILEIFGKLISHKKVQLDITLARGLSYYTGAIFEVRVLNSSVKSSVSGGGRYDDLTGVFGLEGVSGVGFSFGVDRMYDVMEELELFPEETVEAPSLMITNFDEDAMGHALHLLKTLRESGVRAELYPDTVKLKKQLTYANKKNIPFVLMVGSKEIEELKFSLKNMKTGEQQNLPIQEVIEILKKSM